MEFHTLQPFERSKCPDVYLCKPTKIEKIEYYKIMITYTCEPWHENSNNVVYATSKGSDQPAHTRRLIRVFASRLNIL